MDAPPFPHAKIRLTSAAYGSGVEMTLGQAREIVETSVPLFDGRHLTHDATLEACRILYHPHDPIRPATTPQFEAAQHVLRAIQHALPA